MAFLDALLGRIYSRGVEIVLGSGLNFKSPLRAAKNDATGRIDIDIPATDLGNSEVSAALVPQLASRNVIADPSDASQLIHRPSHKLVQLVDEFCSLSTGSVGELNWRTGGTGTPTYAAVEGSVPSSVGTVSMTTSSATNDTARIAGARFFAQYFQRMRWLLDITSIASNVLTVGFGRDVTSADFGASGAYFLFEFSVNPNLRAVTKDGSGTFTSDTGFPVVASDQMNLEIRREGSQLRFYVNESLVAAHSANIPDGDDNFQTFGARLETKVTSSKVARFDRFDAELDFGAANRFE